jgi:enediyne biosynthesis protein E4
MENEPRPTQKLLKLLLPLLCLCGASVNAQFHFTEVTTQAGIHFQHTNGRSGERYFIETLGSGAAWFDYDGDGDADIYFVNGADLPGMESEIPPANALYRNNGDGTFTDITAEAGVGDRSYGFGCCVGDYDNDGFKDLYVTNFGSNILYRNNGDGTFTDVTAEAGVGDERWGTSAAFADYDNDGDLDLFVANYVDYQLENHSVCHRGGLPVYCPPADFEGAPDLLYRNDGDGTFTDVTAEAGVYNPSSKGLGVVWGDYDNDGDSDLFVANDTTPDMLYRNNGDGTFTDIALFVGVALGGKGVALGGMGANFGDYDNDGWLDVVVTNFQGDPNSLYRNDTDGTFADATYASGIGGASLPYVGWGVDFVDLDNDGYQDIFVANGHIYDNVEAFDPGYTYAQRNRVFRNRRDGTFDEISDGGGPGLHLNRVSRGAAFADYDNDGDIDILITHLNQPPELLRNESTSPNHWLILELIGVKSNRDGIGARVKVVTGGIVQIREVKSGSSYLCQSDMRLHFGLGKASVAELVEIRWHSGLVERFEGIAANRFLRVREGRRSSNAHSGNE